MRATNVLMLATAISTGLLALSAKAAVIVSPSAYATTVGSGGGGLPGPIPNNYGATGNRFQEVYSAADFGSSGSLQDITKIAFRAKPSQFAFAIGDSVTVSDIIVTLSTTASSANAGPTFISNLFGNNIGPDVETVYSGPITFTTTGVVNTTSFEYVITLQAPFLYNNGAGNLLLDITTPDGSTTSGPGSIGYAPVDYASGASEDAIAFNGSTSSSTIGANSTGSVITQFTTTAVPEPVFTGAGVACLGLLARRRRVG